MKKGMIFIIVIAMFLASLNLISAINLEVTSQAISNTYISELNEPAVFELSITNLEETDYFEIYSLVGLDILPTEPIKIEEGETKTFQIKITPQKSLISRQGFTTFAYIIKGASGIQEETIALNILNLENTFSITPNNIDPKSEKIIILFKNKAQRDFDDLKIKMSSAFLDYEDTFSIKSLESKELEAQLDLEKLKILNAGQYLFNTEVEVDEKTADIESLIKFLEQEDIDTNELKEGFIIKRYEISKKNVGNIKKSIEITIDKDIFSYLFTTFNIAPTKSNFIGFKKYYTWKKELIPNEELKVIVKTNWLYPILILLFALGLFKIIKKSIETDLILRKKVFFVKTKGGQFALKVSIKLKSKKFIERIHIIDKLPPLVKLYEKYGSISPDKVDMKNRRIEWDIESLNEDEERIFSYIIYSKVGVVGRFELPSAKVTYEKEGKVKETISNRSFFINEPK